MGNSELQGWRKKIWKAKETQLWDGKKKHHTFPLNPGCFFCFCCFFFLKWIMVSEINPPINWDSISIPYKSPKQPSPFFIGKAFYGEVVISEPLRLLKIIEGRNFSRVNGSMGQKTVAWLHVAWDLCFFSGSTIRTNCYMGKSTLKIDR